jgi:hypothetical protein
MRIRRFAPAILAFALVVPGCGDDGGPQLDLTQQEIGELFTAIAEIFEGFADFSMANPGVSLSLLGVLDDINESITCPQGGNAAATGTENSTAGSFDFDADVDFNGCGSRGFTLGGGLNFQGSGTETETTLEADLEISGNLEVETEDGRSGGCNVSLDYSIALSQSGSDFSVSGSICGHNFSQSL